MKLKKSFSASLISLLVLFFSVSCASTSIIPGEGAAKVNNIYTEYYNLAESYYKIEDYTNALKYYNLALKNKKNYWASYYKIAKCYAFKNDWNNALPMYETILKRDPDNDTIKASITYIYLMQGNEQKAREGYLDLLEKQSTNKEYLENYLILIISNKDLFETYKEEFDEKFNLYKENYSTGEALDKLQKKYDEYTKKEEQEDININEQNIDSSDKDEDFITNIKDLDTVKE